MSTVKSLSHSKWECKYHIIWIPISQGNDHIEIGLLTTQIVQTLLLLKLMHRKDALLYSKIGLTFTG